MQYFHVIEALLLLSNLTKICLEIQLNEHLHVFCNLLSINQYDIFSGSEFNIIYLVFSHCLPQFFKCRVKLSNEVMFSTVIIIPDQTLKKKTEYTEYQVREFLLPYVWILRVESEWSSIYLGSSALSIPAYPLLMIRPARKCITNIQHCEPTIKMKVKQHLNKF